MQRASPAKKEAPSVGRRANGRGDATQNSLRNCRSSLAEQVREAKMKGILRHSMQPGVRQRFSLFSACRQTSVPLARIRFTSILSCIKCILGVFLAEYDLVNSMLTYRGSDLVFVEP